MDLPTLAEKITSVKGLKASGRWKVEGGKWKVESGKWKVEGEK